MNELMWQVCYRETGLALSQTSKWCSSRVFGLALNTVICFEYRVCMVAALKRYAVVVFFAGAVSILLTFMGSEDGELDGIKSMVCLRFSVLKWR